MSKFKILLTIVVVSGIIISLLQTILSLMDKDWLVMVASIFAFAIFLIGGWITLNSAE